MINGEISFDGNTVLDGTISTANAFTSFGNVRVDGAPLGDYSSVADSTPVTLNGFSFDPAGTPVNPLWGFSYLGVNYSFILNAISSVTQTASILAVEGTGVASIDGFIDTPGTFVITAQGSPTTTNPTFSSITFSTGRSVPDGGATAGLLGVVMLVLGFSAHKFRK